eukprot:GHVL01032731.1.p1 GENE.GHVL01032731.1~~GHVL01032731.1.p1  ORF type:complete len:124 (+),score=8.12 GHVL01032731.1:82-453(+)
MKIIYKTKVKFSASQFSPKVFMANERTLTHWMHTGVLVTTLSLTLMHMHNSMAHVTGLILAPVAMLLFLYPHYKFTRRAKALEEQMPSSSICDTKGPLMIVIALALAIIVTTLINLSQKLKKL